MSSAFVSGIYELSTSSLPNVWPPPVKALDDLDGGAGAGSALEAKHLNRSSMEDEIAY